MKKLFSGKKKLLTIPLIAIVGIIFLPITILAIIGWFVYHKISNKKIKAVSLSIIGALILFFGSAYVAGFTGPSPSSTKTIEDKTTPTPIKAVEGAQANPTTEPSPIPGSVKVVSVVDGDTIKVNIEGNVETVRLLGIDTPETVDPRKPVECFGKAASDKMKSVVLNKYVILADDSTQGDKDRYGRLLRYVYLSDSKKTFVNNEMIRQGYAYSYREYPTKFLSQFNESEKYAREHNLGLWGSCNISPTATPRPTTVPTSTPRPTAIPTVTPKPTTAPAAVAPTSADIVLPVSSGYSCDCSKTCTQMSSCEEAYYQLNTCGCSARDGDGDGIPCESLCR